MKTFIIKAEAWFDAENIDDAFLKLKEHFYNLEKTRSQNCYEEKALFHGGYIEVYAVREAK